MSLLTNEELTLSAINLDSLNDLLNETHSKIGKIKPLKCLFNTLTYLCLGIRIIKVTDLSTVHDLLLNEVQYLQECSKNPLAILVVDELWSNVVTMANDIDYNIWKLAASSTVLFPKIAHILYELPWKQADQAIDVKSDNVELELAFLEASRNEQLCFSNDLERMPNIRVALGSEIQKSVDQDNHFLTIAVPLVTEDFMFIKSKR